MAEPRPQGRPLAEVPVVKKTLHTFVEFRLFQEFPRAVRGAVIDDDDFRDKIEIQDLLDDLPNRFSFIVNGDDDG
jgi:hypothetical protein